MYLPPPTFDDSALIAARRRVGRLVDNGEDIALEEHEPNLRAGVKAVLLGVVCEQRLHVAQHLLLRVDRLLQRHKMKKIRFLRPAVLPIQIRKFVFMWIRFVLIQI